MKRPAFSNEFRFSKFNRCLGIYPVLNPVNEEDFLAYLTKLDLKKTANHQKVNVVVSNDLNGFIILQQTMDSLGEELNVVRMGSKTYVARYLLAKLWNIKRVTLSVTNAPVFDENGSVLVICGQNYDTKAYDVTVIDFKDIENCSSIFEYITESIKQSRSCSLKSFSKSDETSIIYSTLFEIFEEDEHGSYSSSSRTKDYFKLRRDFNKKVRLFVRNTSENPQCPKFKDCESFALKFTGLKSYVPLSNIVLELGSDDGCSFRLMGDWDVTNGILSKLFETSKNNIIKGQLKIDMTTHDLQRPITITLTFAVCFFENNDIFLINDRSPFHSIFSVRLESTPGDSVYEHDLIEIDYDIKVTDLQLSRIKTTTGMSIGKMFLGDPEDGSHGLLAPHSTGEEQIFSGTEQNKDQMPSTEVCERWEGLFNKWSSMGHMPMELYTLVRETGVPNYFRSNFWKKICKIDQVDENLKTKYYELLKQTSEYEKVISPDVKRTFPLHPYFSDPMNKGQDSLFNICKAYSLYDEEIGYCQGMSFIVATFLIQMDEFSAFSMLVVLMYDYNMRDLFKAKFDTLQEQMYIIRRHVAHTNSRLDKHFNNVGVEPHMYLPQWILTCFTAKFPLTLSNIVIDNLLVDGRDVITKFSLGIIQLSSETLKSMCFDEIMRYFRVSMPRLYYSKVNVINLLKVTKDLNISEAVMEAYKVDYMQCMMKNVGMNELETIKMENRVLFDRLMRMEAETDVIAQELISTQFTFQNRLAEDEGRIFAMKRTEDELREKIEFLEKKLKNKTEEGEVLLDTLQDKLCNHLDEVSRKDSIIAQYKNICKTLEDSSNKLQLEHESMVRRLQDGNTLCKNCIEKLNEKMEKPEYIYQPMDTGLTNVEAELVHAKVALADAEEKIAYLQKNISDLEKELKSSWIHKLTSNMKN